MIGVRYETTPEQLRFLLARLREILLAHPRVTDDPARVRFVGFGAYSLDLEVFAYVDTSDWSEFLEIREDIYLHFMDVHAPYDAPRSDYDTVIGSPSLGPSRQLPDRLLPR